MRIRKDLLIAAFCTFCLTIALFSLIPRSNSPAVGQYDPWLDYDDNGRIDMNDIYYSAKAFGQFGDPTKNVAVTNWPEETEMFPNYLCLKTAITACTGYRYDLIEEDVPYLPYVDTYYHMSGTINSSVWTIFFNRTFIYQSIPEHSYRILGMPSVYLPFNLSNYPSLPDTFAIEAQAYLGKISFNGQWTLLKYLGLKTTYWTGQNMGALAVFHIFNDLASPLNFTINTYERLAIKILGLGKTNSGTTNVGLDLLCDTRNHGIVQIPIMEDV